MDERINLVLILTVLVVGCDGNCSFGLKIFLELQDKLTSIGAPPCKSVTCEGPKYCFDELGCFNIDPNIWCINRTKNFCPTYNKNNPSTFALYTRKNLKGE